MNECEIKYQKLMGAYRREILANTESGRADNDIALLTAIDKMRTKNLRQELYIDHIEELLEYFMEEKKTVEKSLN